MKKQDPLIVALNVLIALGAAFALSMLILFLCSSSILPSGEQMEVSEQLGMTLGYVLTGIVLTALPSVIVCVALIVIDICLAAIKAKRKVLIACIIVLSLFLPLFIVSTLTYYVIVEYVKWLYAILIPAYMVYVAAIVVCAIALARENRKRAAQLAEEKDAKGGKSPRPAVSPVVARKAPAKNTPAEPLETLDDPLDLDELSELEELSEPDELDEEV